MLTQTCVLQFWRPNYDAPPDNALIKTLLKIEKDDRIQDIHFEQDSGASCLIFKSTVDYQGWKSKSEIGKKWFWQQAEQRQNEIAEWVRERAIQDWKSVSKSNHQVGILIRMSKNDENKDTSRVHSNIIISPELIRCISRRSFFFHISFLAAHERSSRSRAQPK